MADKGAPVTGQQFTVKPHRPWRRRLLWLMFFAALSLAAWQIFERGRLQAGYDRHVWQNLEEELRNEIAELKMRNDELLKQNALLERSAEIERNAHNEVKTALAETQTQMIELREELLFYRGLVSPPDERDSGLHIQALILSAGAKLNLLRFKLTLTQIRNNDRYAVGTVDFRLVGTESGKNRSYALSDISKTAAKALQFKFKHFQNLESEFELPAGFKPLAVKLEVTPKSSRLKPVVQEFSWDAVYSGGS